MTKDQIKVVVLDCRMKHIRERILNDCKQNTGSVLDRTTYKVYLNSFYM